MIRHATAVEAFSAAASAMATDHNVVDIATSLLWDCTAILPAASAAIMVKRDDGQLVLLHSSSHRVAEIEMLQIQSDRGPCVESIAGDALVSATGAQALRARWGEVGEAIVRAGYAHVSAFPMRWHDRVLGGFNVFRADAEPMSDLDTAVAQGFVNMAALALVRPADLPVNRLAARVAEAVQSRSVIEQAKGVLAYLHDVDPSTAYDLLLDMVTDDGQSITAVAGEVIAAQRS
jgi:hypothetical protein